MMILKHALVIVADRQWMVSLHQIVIVHPGVLEVVANGCQVHGHLQQVPKAQCVFEAAGTKHQICRNVLDRSCMNPAFR